jgi:hypothetical protein
MIEEPPRQKLRCLLGASVVRQSAVIVAHTGMNATPLVVPAAQWSRHSCLHFKCRGLARDRSNFHGSIVSRRLNNCATKQRPIRCHEPLHSDFFTACSRARLSTRLCYVRGSPFQHPARSAPSPETARTPRQASHKYSATPSSSRIVPDSRAGSCRRAAIRWWH